MSQFVFHCASHKISSLHEIQKPYYNKLRSTFPILNFTYSFFYSREGHSSASVFTYANISNLQASGPGD